MLGKAPTDEFEETKITEEVESVILILVNNSTNSADNGSSSYLFVNGVKIY